MVHRPRTVPHAAAHVNLARNDHVEGAADFERSIALQADGGSRKRLASDYVELGQLQYHAGDFQAALASFDAAIRTWPDYPPAHGQPRRHFSPWAAIPTQDKRSTAISVRTWCALAGYLRGKGTGPPSVAPSIQKQSNSFTRGLQVVPNKKALAYRGWAYLKANATQLAMADFEAVLRLDSANIDALCGRGHARVRLRQVAAGVQDAEEALRRGLRKPPQLFSLACLYAQAALQTRVAQRGTLAKCGDQFLYQEIAPSTCSLRSWKRPPSRMQGVLAGECGERTRTGPATDYAQNAGTCPEVRRRPCFIGPWVSRSKVGFPEQ